RFVVEMNALKHTVIERMDRGKYRELGLKVLYLILGSLRFVVEMNALKHTVIERMDRGKYRELGLKAS
ncbi:MAG: hypothetical protein KH276_09570, partial [Prevotella histicola]|nr:hypothetical protein [Prevotella histicola]